MANRNEAGFGLIPAGTLGNTPSTQGLSEYFIDAGDSANKFNGMAVQVTAGYIVTAEDAATAESVGDRLSILSKTEQILLITHSPQVAAKANKHWKVSKKITEDGFPISFTRELDEDNKKKELARMISGKVVTKEAIAAAEKLMPQHK